MKNLKTFITRETTQKKVAEDIGISQQNLSNYINGKTQPDYDTMIKLAEYFHTTIDSLIGHNVPYLLDKSTLSQEQRNLIDEIINLTREQCLLTGAYIQGLKKGEQNRQETILKIRS